MILKDVLTEYRNKNKKAIGKIFTNSINNNGSIGIKILDEELERTIKKTYADYVKEGIAKRKKVIAVFNGDINDMAELFISELYILFNDESFEPPDESAIFKALKYNVVKSLNQELNNEPITRSIYAADENDDEYELLPETLIYDSFSDVPESRYCGANKGLLKILSSVEIERLCRSNAETQINVANLIKKYYMEIDGRYPSLDKMLEYYKFEYGYEISKNIYSRSLNNLFNLICDNTIIYKGLNINRRDYISRHDSEGNIKSEIVPTIDCCCLNSDDFLLLIDLCNRLDGYSPGTVAGDRFYNIGKQDRIIEVCFKYKRLVKLLKNVDKLSLEDYSDVLEAVCIMVNEYTTKHIKSQLVQFMEQFGIDKFDASYDTIFELAMGKSASRSGEPGYWTICKKKDGLHIMSFRHLENDMYFALKGKADIKIDCKKIYQIGKCKFIVSKEKIYCRSVYKELVNVKCCNNKYSACRLNA